MKIKLVMWKNIVTDIHCVSPLYKGLLVKFSLYIWPLVPWNTLNILPS
jgi:hypothetical protein